MTDKLYYKDSHIKTFDAQVLSCEPVEQAAEDGKKKKGKAPAGPVASFRIVLDQTAFFPEGGGQFADTGVLRFMSDAQEITVHVLDVREKNGIAFHMTDAPIPEGTSVFGEIDWDKRFDRMQQHSGEHLISGLVNRMYGFDNVGFHLGDEETTLDFCGFLSKEQLAEIELLANKAVWMNFPVKVLYPSKEELAQMTYRSKIEIEGQVRIVEYPGYDVCACCAPHVDRTGEIGIIKIVHSMAHRGGVRVTILCGQRALMDHREKEASVKAISVLLSAKEPNVAEAVEHLKEDQFKLRGQLMILQEQRLDQELAKIPSGSQNVHVILEDLATDSVRDFVNELMKKCTGYCAAFYGSDEEGYKYIIGSSTDDVRPLGKELNAALTGRGGGKPEMIQGSVKGTAAQIDGFLANR